jgi:hypothetical protein
MPAETPPINGPIKPGDWLLVRNVFDRWEPATVVAPGVEGIWKNGRKIHDFPVVWVDIAGADGPMPWPLDEVRRPRVSDPISIWDEAAEINRGGDRG